MAQRVSRPESIANLNVIPGAQLRVIDDSSMDRPVWKTLESSIPYTPRAINEALRKHGLTSAWVIWTCGKELWFAGDQLATH